jgi:uncharacterized membrane protein YcaP (DUF421 family)
MFIEIFPAFLEGSAWSHMFALDHEKVTWIEKILRPILVYAALIFFLRLFGKRELAQLNPFDLVVLISLSNTVQNAIIGDDTSLSGGIVGAASLLGINFVMAHFKYRSKKIEAFIEGSPRILIENGEINREAIARELLTEEDLDVIAHKQGIETVGEIKKCILDANGNFLVIGKKDDKDDEYKKDVLDKINNLTAQLSELQNSLQKA